jgi:hypothetical protein
LPPQAVRQVKVTPNTIEEAVELFPRFKITIALVHAGVVGPILLGRIGSVCREYVNDV